MASDSERQPVEDTVVVDGHQVGARDDEWPVSELYRIEPKDGVGEDRAPGGETSVVTAPAEPPSRRGQRRGLGVLLAIMLAAGAVVLVGALLASRGEGQSPRRSASARSAMPVREASTIPARTDTVPNLEGMTVADARGVLRRLRLHARVRTTPSERPRGIVLRQDPAEGTTATRGDIVTLVVSSGVAAPPATVTVPTVVGRTASEATGVLRDAGLVAKIHLVPSTEQAGIVVRQSPEGAAKTARGSAIRLDVAKARPIPQRIEVPDLVGLTASDARRQLADLGLTAEIVRLSSPEPVGTVLRQAPRAGSRLAEKSRVTLTVSSGPENADVPDVTGLDEGSARAELESQGFGVRVTYEPTSDPAEDGSVVRQTPVGGSSAAAGSVITIVVARLG
jgi:beta-lactam-binding protein with PASTA domain